MLLGKMSFCKRQHLHLSSEDRDGSVGETAVSREHGAGLEKQSQEKIKCCYQL